MRLEELVNRHYEQLNGNEREILSYILKHKNQVREDTCQETAKKCSVSRATLLRVCKKLGLQNYAELKYILKYGEEEEKPRQDSIDSIISNYHTLIEDLKKTGYQEVCRLIYHARNIYIYGTGNEQKAVAEEFKRIFLMFGKCAVDLFDYGEVQMALETFTEKDLFVIISLSGETQEGIRILRLMEHTGIRALSLTRWKNNTIARMCPYNLYAGTKVVDGYGQMSYEIMSAFYILLDILSVHYLSYLGEQSLQIKSQG